jgi:hypothetical protein
MEDELHDAQSLTAISRVIIVDTERLFDRMHQEIEDARRVVSDTRRSIEKARRLCAKADALLNRARRG